MLVAATAYSSATSPESPNNIVGDDSADAVGNCFVSYIFSIRGAIAFLSLFMIASTGIIVSYLSESSCDQALTTTRDHTTESLAECFATSTLTLGLTVADLLFISSSAAESSVLAFLDTAVLEAQRLNVQVELLNVGANFSDEQVLLDQRPRLWHQMQALSSVNSGLFGVGINAPQTQVSLNYEAGHLMSILGTAENRTHFEMSAAQPITGAIMRFPQARHMWLKNPDTFGSQELIYRPGFFQAREPRWGALDQFSQYIGMLLMTNMTHVDPNLPPGLPLWTVAYVQLSGIKEFLSGLAAKTKATTGADTRIFSCIAGSWMYEKMKLNRAGFSDEQFAYHQQQDTLTGVSHGLGFTSTLEPDPVFMMERNVTRKMKDVDADDSVIRGVARAIHAYNNSYEGINMLESKSTRLKVTRERREDDFQRASDAYFKTLLPGDMVEEEYYVTVLRVSDGRGIDWWLTTALDTQHVLHAVTMKNQEVQESTAAETERVQDKVDKQRLESRMIIVGFGFLLVGFVILVIYYILKPIRVIQHEMSNVAKLNINSSTCAVKATSPFNEVREMQANFLKMTANLLEFRAYVPESILSSDSMGSTTDMLEKSRRVAPPTGDIAVVFTDIQGSTKLWKRSAIDMNLALEQHNEIIRAVYRNHDGYEVKTIGDAFMLTFQEAVPAVRCALDIQHRFKQASWPERLRLPEAGLVVRIGIHYGSTIAEENPITGRVDYRGSTVNMASRTEAKAKGGTICVTRSVITAIGNHKGGMKDLIHSPVLHQFGRHELKGLGHGHELFLLAPGYLSHRYVGVCAETANVVTELDRDGSVGSALSAVARSEAKSTDTSIMHNAYIGGVTKKTELFLTRTTGTVAVCKLNGGYSSSGHIFEDFNLLVRSAAEAAISLDGQVASVSSAEVILTWNASKCKQHVTSALRFAEHLEVRTQSIMCLGIATGDFMHGNVGTTKQRYTTSLGLPLVVAEAAAEYAEDADFYCSYADATRGSMLRSFESQHIAECLFLADIWFYEKLNVKINIFQVSSESLSKLLSGWAFEGTELSASFNDSGMSRAKASQESAKCFEEIFQSDSTEVLKVKMEDIRSLTCECALATHHLTLLEDVRLEDMHKGYRTVVDFNRAPPKPNKRKAVPTQAPFPPPPTRTFC